MLRKNIKIVTRILFLTIHCAPHSQKEKTTQGMELIIVSHIFNFTYVCSPSTEKVFIYVVK